MAYPYTPLKDTVERFMRLPFPDAVREILQYENAQRRSRPMTRVREAGLLRKDLPARPRAGSRVTKQLSRQGPLLTRRAGG